MTTDERIGKFALSDDSADRLSALLERNAELERDARRLRVAMETLDQVRRLCQLMVPEKWAYRAIDRIDAALSQESTR